jgi:hypothetical protein
MNLYLDDDIGSDLLALLLRRAGHDVLLPRDAGTSGSSDPRHLQFAIQRRRTFVTGNHQDFAELHDLVQEAGGQHSGILTVRSDNDPTRDMKPKDIVSAIRKLEQSRAAIANQIHVLNHWR